MKVPRCKWLVALVAPALACSAHAGIDAFDWSRVETAGINRNAFSTSFDSFADRMTWSFNLGTADAQFGSYLTGFDRISLDDARAWTGASPSLDSARQDTLSALRLIRMGGNLIGVARALPMQSSWESTTAHVESGFTRGLAYERVGDLVAEVRPAVPTPAGLALLAVAALVMGPRRRST